MSLLKRLRSLWTYILGLSMLPLTYVLSAPCGFCCGACPLCGPCYLLLLPGYLLLIPVVVLGVFTVKSVRSLRERSVGLIRFFRGKVVPAPGSGQDPGL